MLIYATHCCNVVHLPHSDSHSLHRTPSSGKCSAHHHNGICHHNWTESSVHMLRKRVHTSFNKNIFVDQVRHKFYAPQVHSDQGSNSLPSDHDVCFVFLFHVRDTFLQSNLSLGPPVLRDCPFRPTQVHFSL